MNTGQKKVVILGGGIAGLTVAHELIERGLTVELYESSHVFGGKARSLYTKDGHPAEHSPRTVMRTYYHLRDTMNRIPYRSGTLLANISPLPAGSKKLFLFEQAEGLYLPSYFPWKLSQMRDYRAFWKKLTHLFPKKELMKQAYRLLKIICMCQERRIDLYDNITWEDFCEVQDNTNNVKEFILKIPEFFAAAGHQSNARPMAMLEARLLLYPFNHPISSQRFSTDVFNGPSSEALINPWVDYLKKLGVQFYTNHRAIELKAKDQELSEIIVETDLGEQKKIKADYYVSAIPIEALIKLVEKNDIKSKVPSFAHLNQLTLELSSSIQFYNKNPEAKAFPGTWIAFGNSPWSIVAIYQSNLIWPDTKFKEPVTGILSVAWSNFHQKGIVYGKSAKDCTAEEMKEEVLAQMRAHQGANIFLDTLDIYDWHIDPSLIFSKETGQLIDHTALLFVQPPGSKKYQPKTKTEINNLYMAGDFVDTTFDIATMEAANEAGRRAANAVLQDSKYKGKLAFVRKRTPTGIFFFAEYIDSLLYKFQKFRVKQEI